jgi:hypothetical protein
MRDGKISLRAHNLLNSKLCKNTYSNMKFTILLTLFAALVTTGFSAAVVAADAIPVAAVDETAPQGITNGSKENHRVLRAANEPAVAGANDKAAPDGGAPATEGKRALGTKGAPSGGNKKDYSGQSCSLCCDDDYHC